MKKLFQQHMKNQTGMSLVEILASVVILSILLFFVLGMFVNSSKVNVKSEEVIDATYVAQTEIENLYAVSKQKKFAERKTEIDALPGYDHISGDPLNPLDPFLFFEKDTADYSIFLKIENDIPIDSTDPNYKAMTSAILEVEAKVSAVGDNTSAKMELLLQWERDPTP